ncbi:MAG: RtcB family protein [Streptosporangiales bacterium]
MSSTVPGRHKCGGWRTPGLASRSGPEGVAVVEIVEEAPYRFVLPRHGRMRVPGVVFATRALLPDLAGDRSLQQVANVAELPGIVEASYAMPDVHWGIPGVAATDVADGGVVSPGGVGFDISCGVRLLAADLDSGELAPVLGRVMTRCPLPPRGGPGAAAYGRCTAGRRCRNCCSAEPPTRCSRATAPRVTWIGAKTTARSVTLIPGSGNHFPPQAAKCRCGPSARTFAPGPVPGGER